MQPPLFLHHSPIFTLTFNGETLPDIKILQIHLLFGGFFVLMLDLFTLLFDQIIENPTET